MKPNRHPYPKKKKRFTCIYETSVYLKIKIVLKQLQKRDATFSSFSFIYCQLLSISVPLKRSYRITQKPNINICNKNIYVWLYVQALFLAGKHGNLEKNTRWKTCSFILALLPSFQNHVFYNSRLAGTLMYIT